MHPLAALLLWQAAVIQAWHDAMCRALEPPPVRSAVIIRFPGHYRPH